jgi:hypothetical protein
MVGDECAHLADDIVNLPVGGSRSVGDGLEALAGVREHLKKRAR